MCPEIPMAYVLMARLSTINDYWLGTTKSPRESLEKAIELVQKALAMDDSYSRGPRPYCVALYAKKGV